MNANNYRILKRNEVLQYSTPMPHYVFIQYFSQLLIFIIFVFASIYFENTYLTIITLFVCGGFQHSLGLYAHEGAHHMVFKNHRLNDFISRIIFAGPIGIPFGLYRIRHFSHHKNTCTKLDTKEQYKREIFSIYLAFIELLRSLIGFDYLMQIKSAFKTVKDRKNTVMYSTLSKLYDLASIIASNIFIALLFALLTGDLFNYFLYWVFPLVTTCMLFSKIRSIAEHHPYKSESFKAERGDHTYYLCTNGPVIRSVRVHLAEKFFLSPINFNYHFEHHLYPGVSSHFLPQINSRLVELDVSRGARECYIETILNLVRGK